MKTKVNFLSKLVMFSIAIPCLLIVFFNGLAHSANQFRSSASGNWNVASTWEYSTNGGTNWLPAVVFPTVSDSTVTIQNYTVNVPAGQNFSIDEFIIYSGTLSLSGSLTIKDGNLTDLLLYPSGTITGTGILKSSGSGTLLDIQGTGFNAPFEVVSGITTVHDLLSGEAEFSNSMTIDTGAILTTTPDYRIRSNSTVTNNGTITGGSITSNFNHYGSSFVNNGAITIDRVHFNSSTSISGSATWSTNLYISSLGIVTIPGNYTMNFGNSASQKFEIQGTLNLNSNTLTLNNSGNTFTFLYHNGGLVTNSGLIKTTGTIRLDIQGHEFNAPFEVVSGITTVHDELNAEAEFGNSMTIDAGAILTTTPGYRIRSNSTVTNNGTITGGSITSNFKHYGSSFVNNGAITIEGVYFYSSTTISGSATWSTNCYITSKGIVTVLGGMNFGGSASQIFEIGGTLNLNSNTLMNFVGSASQLFEIRIGGTLNLNSNTLTLNNSNSGSTFTFRYDNGGLITNSGLIKTTGTITLDLRGTGIPAPVEISSGTTTCVDYWDGEAIFNNTVTIDAGAILTTPSIPNIYWIRSNSTVTNNGTITGGESSLFKHYGSSFVNNGAITIISGVYFYSLTSVSGFGTWSTNCYITSTGIVTVPSNYTMNFGGSASQLFEIQSGGTLNLNSNTMTLNNSGSTFTFQYDNGGLITNSGLIKTTGTIKLDLRGTGIPAPVEIISGTTTCQDLSDGEAIFNNTVTIDAGAILTTPTSQNIHGIRSNSTVINNGTITGGESFSYFKHYGSSFVNNGIVSIGLFYFQPVTSMSNQTVSGTGSFTSPSVNVVSNVNLTLGSNHQFDNILIEGSASLDLSDKVLKLNGSGTLINNSGSFISPNGIVECNRGSAQILSVINVSFVNLRINNSSGVSLETDINVSGNLEITNGDLNTNNRVIILGISATISETTGNTVTGNDGYIVTIRNIGVPNNLNVGNMGAALTSTANFGSTEVRRYHAEQTIPPTGNKSIKRYFIITPTNNSNLNATFTMKYDESELNGNVESTTLSQYKSTNAGSSYLLENSSTSDILNNTVTATGINSFSRHTISNTGSVAITFTPQGLYNQSTNKLNIKDTVRAFLANAISPFNFLDSAKGVLDSVTLTAMFRFADAVSGNYYFVVRHRNSIETWSQLTQSYTYTGNSTYSFTTANTQAFGNNMIQVDASPVVFGIYSGDVGQDGAVDLADLATIDNAAYNFLSGYVVSDLNGDYFVDLNDAAIVDNNAFNFVSVVRP